MCLVKIQNISNAVYYRLAVVSPYVGIGQKQNSSSNQCITRQDSQATKKTSVIITEKSCFADVQTKILASLACCSVAEKLARNSKYHCNASRTTTQGVNVLIISSGHVSNIEEIYQLPGHVHCMGSISLAVPLKYGFSER